MLQDDRKETPLGPSVPVPGDDETDLLRKCTEERQALTRKETADCAGATLAESYENEEDGGS